MSLKSKNSCDAGVNEIHKMTSFKSKTEHPGPGGQQSGWQGIGIGDFGMYILGSFTDCPEFLDHLVFPTGFFFFFLNYYYYFFPFIFISWRLITL